MLLFTPGELIEAEETGEGSGSLTEKLGFRSTRTLSLKSETILGLDSSWLGMAERRGFSRSGKHWFLGPQAEGLSSPSA